MKERILDAASFVLGLKAADEAQVTVLGGRSSVVRFADSVFHQGSVETDIEVYVRALVDGSSGVASANSLDRAALRACALKAAESARRMKGRSTPCALPGPAVYPAVDSYFEETAAVGAAEKTGLLSACFRGAARSGALVSGAYSTKAGEVAVVNSRGVEAYHDYTAAHLNMVATADGSSGARTALSKDVRAIDAAAMVEEAAATAAAGRGAAPHPPGRYLTLLEPQAVAELLYWLSYSGFGAKNFMEGTSALSGRIGKEVTGRNVTIREDGTSPLGMAAPFDMEGAPTTRYCIIEAGVARGVAQDSSSAAGMTGKASSCPLSTGNAPLPDDPEGPLPDRLFMEGGDRSIAELVSMMDGGVLVKSFHYVNGFLNASESMMTGMTRHGAFLVEGGRVARPVASMRFTANVLDSFRRIKGLSRETGLFTHHDFPLTSISAPALLIDGFDFTG